MSARVRRTPAILACQPVDADSSHARTRSRRSSANGRTLGMPLREVERPGGEEGGEERRHLVEPVVVERPVGGEGRLRAVVAAPRETGQVVLHRPEAGVLEVVPARPRRRPENVAEMHVAVDRPHRAGDRLRREPRVRLAQDLGFGRRQAADHVLDLVEPLEPRQASGVALELRVEVAERLADGHGVGALGIVLDVLPEADHEPVALVRARRKLGRRPHDRRACLREERGERDDLALPLGSA